MNDRKMRRELERMLPPGFEVVQSKCNHYRFVGPDGEPLRAKNGMPLSAAMTPSAHSGPYKRVEADIRRALQ